MKKRILSFIIAVCLFIPCMFLMTACGGDSVPGTYKATEITYGDETLTKADLEEKINSEDLGTEQFIYEMFLEMMNANSFELKKDNTVVMTSVFDGETETQTGTWAQDGDKVTISYSEDGEDISVEFTFKDGKLTMTESDMGMTTTIVYSKSK